MTSSAGPPAARVGAVSVRGAEGVYAAVRTAISTGEFAPGEPLVELQLAARYGVSRTPVREALRRLEQDRLVERGARGLAVRRVDAQEVLEIYEARMVLEAAVARAAAERRSDVDLAVLQSMIDADRRDAPAAGEERARRNHEFHAAVWAASRNRVLVDLLERLGMHLLRHPETTLAWPGRWEQALDQHQELVDALHRRDGDAAAEVATRHFSDARDVRLASWRSRRPGR